MNRPCTLATLALILAAGRLDAAAADPSRERGTPPAVLEAAPAGTVVMDDDGGRVQIVPRAAAPGGKVADHGGPVVTRGAVQLIFLGSGWRERANRGREAGVMKALEALEAIGDGATAAAPRSGGGSGPPSFALPAREDLLDPVGGGTISDLEIQARLDELLANGTIGPLAVDSVFVVLLAPGIRSTLGASSSETDFTAYHNFFHAAPGLVRYVVVPYEARLSRWFASAREGLTQALVNPEGTGWY